MPSPSKRQKKVLQSGKTLDYFFSKDRQPPSPGPKPRDEAADEEYARKLAEEWAKEDGGVQETQLPGLSAAGVKKRPRSSNSEKVPIRTHLDTDPARPVAPQTVSGDGASPAPAIPQTPKKAISVQSAGELSTAIGLLPLDQDPLSFNPDVYRQLRELLPDGKATYGLLTRAFVLVNSTRSRIKIVDTITNFLRTLIRLDPDSLLAAV